MTTAGVLDERVVYHRYYDPTVGQFLSVDPMLSTTGEPYAYGGGNPVNGSDPAGLCDVPSGDPNQPLAHAQDGPCTREQAFLLELQAQSLSAGSSIYAGEELGTDPWAGLKGGVNALRGIGNAFIGTVSFGSVSVSNLYADDPNVSWTFGLGEGAGYADVGLGTVCPLAGDLLDSAGMLRGGELRTPSGNWRFNPFGDPNSENRWGRLPHYHRRGPGGIGKHRPWPDDGKR